VSRYGIIAGNGRFPLLALEEARRLGLDVVAVGIKGEAAPEIEQLAVSSHWVTIGELSKLIDILHQERVEEVMLAGQVKHASIFSSVRPDWKLFKLLASLKEKNTDSLIGAIVSLLEEEGIRVIDSTVLLKPLLAGKGPMGRRKPGKDEEADAKYGRRVASALSGFDVGQSVVICERACVAVEAMEGTDAVLRRAAGLVNGRPLTLVKGSRRRRHMLFDVPVAGPGTVAVMKETGATMLAVDAGRTLLLDRAEMLDAADSADICVAGYESDE
jgi:DUF1009 family protein